MGLRLLTEKVLTTDLPRITDADCICSTGTNIRCRTRSSESVFSSKTLRSTDTLGPGYIRHSGKRKLLAHAVREYSITTVYGYTLCPKLKVLLLTASICLPE